jgi:hypothetical protein
VRVDVFERKIRIDPVETPLYNQLRIEGMSAGDGELDFTISKTRAGLRVKVDRSPRGLELDLPA